MSTITFRFAEESDNEGILDLARRCPQEGMITFFVNRTPRFNTLHRLLDPDAWHYVACTEDRIIGLVGVVCFQANVLGKTCKVGYMLDLRVDEAYRSGTTAFRLVKTAINHLEKSDIDMVIANFVKDNNRSLVFTKGRGKLPRALNLGRNRIVSLIPLLRMKENPRFTISPLLDQDIPEVVEFYRKHGKNFKISSEMSEIQFRNLLENVGGLSADRFLVARENGKMKAFTGFWDEHMYKSYQVLKLTRQITLINRFIQFLSLFMKVPHPIKLNHPLRQLSLVLYAHDDCHEALESLFRHINNLHRGSEYTLIMLMAQENDPVLKALKKFIQVSVHSEMYLFAKDPSVYSGLDENGQPVQFDLSMIL